MPKIKRFLSSSLLIVSTALLFPVVVIAAHYVIDTNDAVIDSNWSAVTATVIDGNDYPDDNWDIDRAWVTNNGNFAYFRASLVGPGSFNFSQDNYVVARLDCNRNGSLSDAQDILVFYNPNLDYALECQGNDQPDCPAADLNSDTYGEEIPGSPANFEWMAATTGTIDWSACTGSIDISFSTYDYLLNTTHDTTPVVSYNVPTVVNLQQFSANGITQGLAWLLLAIGLAGMALLGLSFHRLQLRPRSLGQDSDR